MGKWLRVDANWRQHPKARKAGFWGQVVTAAAWEIAKAFDRPAGEITQWWDAEYLAEWTRFDRSKCGAGMPDIERGMRKAEDAGFIERADGKVFVHDFDEYQRDPGAAARKRKSRESKMSRVTDVTRDGCDVTMPRVTSQNVTQRDGTERDGTEQNRTKETLLPRSASQTGGGGKSRVIKSFDSYPGWMILFCHDWIKKHPFWGGQLPYPDGDPLGERLFATKAWLPAVDKLHRIDGRTQEEIRDVLRKICSGGDSFTEQNIRTPGKLREKQKEVNGGKMWWYRVVAGPQKFDNGRGQPDLFANQTLGAEERLRQARGG